MSDKLPALLSDVSLGLDKSFFDKYQSFDEKQSLYSEIKQAAAASSWMQADFFKYLWEESDEKTLNKFAGTVHESPGTINNYIRTAQAFSPEQRNPMASFSHHFQASLADSYDSKTKTFQGNTRETWLDKSILERWTTRKLNEEIMRNKKIKQLPDEKAQCTYCSDSNDDPAPYNFFNTQTKHADHFYFHDECYKKVIEDLES